MSEKHHPPGGYGPLPNGQPPVFGPLAVPQSNPAPSPHFHGPPANADADDEASLFSPHSLLLTLQRWWKLIVPLGTVLAGVAAAILIWQFEPSYVAETIVKIEDQTPYIAFKDGDPEGNSKTFVATQIELMRSDVVLGPIAADDEIAKIPEIARTTDPLGFLRSAVSIRRIGSSALYRIEATCKDPLGAKLIADAVVRQYLKKKDELDGRNTDLVIDLLNKKQDSYLAELESHRKRVREAAKQITGRDPMTGINESDVTRSSLDSLRNLLVTADVQRAELQARIDAFYEVSKGAVMVSSSPQLLAIEVDAHPEVASIINTIDQMRAQLSSYRASREQQLRYWRPDAYYDRLLAAIETQEQQLLLAKDKVRQDLKMKNSAVRKQNQKEQLAALQRELLATEERFKTLQKRYEEELLKVQDASALGVDFESMQSELRRRERVYEMIAARQIALITEISAPTRVQLWGDGEDGAKVPKQPIETLPVKPLAVACMLAFAAPFGLAVGLELLLRRVSDAQQLQQQIGRPIFGEIAQLPMIPVRAGNLPLHAQRSLGIVGECYESLRTTLMLSGQLHRNCVLTIASSASEEGKTTVATQLALSTARAANELTLVIDGDVRKPDLHQALNVPLTPGLSEVLRGECDVYDAIHEVPGTRLLVMPAGELKESPHDLIQSNRIGELLATLREKYSVIIVDTSPVLAASEALVFARHADTVVYAAMRGESRLSRVKSAVDRLTRTGANVAGAVLSGTPVRTHVYRDGYYDYGYYNHPIGAVEHHTSTATLDA